MLIYPDDYVRSISNEDLLVEYENVFLMSSAMSCIEARDKLRNELMQRLVSTKS